MPIPSQNNFANIIEERAGEPQDYVCFLDAETGQTVTYFDLRLRGAWLARELEAQNVVRGGACALDLGNTASFLYAVVAAAYGGFTLVPINKNLPEEEKKRRVADVKQALGVKHLPLLNEATAQALVAGADAAGQNARNVISQWARRGVGAFDEDALALVMLKAGTAGKQKAVPLSWAALLGEARAFNGALCEKGKGIWQLVLPLFHVDGIQVFFRSVLNHNALVLYKTFSAPRVLQDAYTYSATHIALGDKMLQDLLDFNEEAGLNNTGKSPLENYECILVDAAYPNKQTLIRALGQHVPVFMVYGRTETASYIAAGRLADSECLELDVFDGYTITVVAPDALGFGKLGVAGPSVIREYLNARAAFTADGLYLTGDTARFADGKLEFTEPDSDVFSSGGEDVYPEEIRNKILAFEGVTDAYVFGAADDVWGHRPVAFVEAGEAASRPGFNRFYAADDMRNRLSTRLEQTHMPDQFVFVNEFPRTSVGKVGVGTLERIWDARIQVSRVELWHLRIPFVEPIRMAKTRLRSREVLVVRLTDYAGRTGIGECSAFDTNWYSNETIATDLPLLRDALAPLLVGRVLLHPNNASELFENAPGALDAPFACAALENALWDLYGKIRGRSIRQLIGARDLVAEAGSLHEIPAGCVHGGVSIGMGTVTEILAKVHSAVEAGYHRVKLAIKPGSDVEVVRAVREAYPDLMIMVAANQSYHDDQLDILKALDELGVECIEEPLDPFFTPTVGPTDLFDRLTRLQTNLRMRVCLDESWQSADALYEILESHPELRCVTLKIAKFGGVSKALEFHAWARERGIEAWPGGLYDTGISKRLHAAFGLLPGVNLPGDISDSACYFTVDITTPPLELPDGVLLINDNAHPSGLGCTLNESVLANVTENYWICE